MPVRRADYSRAHALILAGATYGEAAEKLGISRGALARYGQRHGWQQTRHEVGERVSQIVEAKIQDSAEGWIKEVKQAINPALKQLKTYDWTKAHDLDAEAAIRVLKTIDDLGRRALGIQDASQGGSQTLVQVVVNGGSGITVKSHPNTLDVTNPE